MKMPTLFYWKKWVIITGTVLSMLILIYLSVITVIEICNYVSDGQEIKDYSITIVYGVLFVLATFGEFIGLLGAIKNNLPLIKHYLVYCALYFLYLLVDVFYVANLNDNYPKLKSDELPHTRHSLLNQSSYARLFWSLLWDAVVVLFLLDLKKIQVKKHTINTAIVTTTRNSIAYI